MKPSIKQQLFVVIIIFLLLAITLLGAFMYLFFTNKMSDFMLAEFDYNIEQNVLESENILKRMQSFNDYLSLNADMVSVVKNAGDDSVEKVYAVNQFKREYEQLFNMYFSDYSNSLTALFLVEESYSFSDFVTEFQDFTEPLDVLSVQRLSDTVKAFIEKQNTETTNEIFMFCHSEHPDCLFFAQRVRDNVFSDGSVLGFNIFKINFERLFSGTNSTSSKEAISLAVLDNRQNIILKPDFVQAETLLRYAKEPSRYKNGGLHGTEKINSATYHVGYYYIRAGLTMLAFVNTEYITTQLGNLWFFVLLFAVLILAVLIFVANMMAKRLSAPIVDLSRVMRRFDEKAEIHLDNSYTYTAEVGELYQCFSDMVGRIKELMKQAKESGEREKEMEIRMLNAQINPHFLYNALDSISWMAIDKGEDEIAEMLNILSDGFRYSIKQMDGLICLRDEMAFIIGYLQLQEMRYKNKFIFSLDIDPEIERLMIPKFVIQPLVENFVIHGIKPAAKNVLTISAQAEEGILEISVSDNGTGCDVEALNRYIAGDETVFPKEKIGIKNVNSRIKIKFGDAYGLRYYRNENGGTLARLRMPIVEK
ncbi:MAG: sensor histidine kinase, partial [Clostridia bacterium]|nr:sensor histidine kinase [Clostridia bacterium]